jgi:mono/diheme cytochrome c family protein
MEKRRLIAIVIAVGALSLGLLTACGGGNDAAGTLGGEVTIGTGTNPTSTPVDAAGANTDAAADATTAADTGATTAAAPAGEGDAAAGAAVFQSAGCGGCHTLAAAGSNGAVGPNLDDLKPSYDAVMTQVTNGGGGMPAFSGSLSADDIKNVSAYVSQNAGK